MTTPDQQPSEFAISAFDDSHIAMATIAAAHLEVRYIQREDGENWTQHKVDITNSQADLNAIDAYYIVPGGNFFLATDQDTNKLAGFVGLKRVSAQVGELKRLAVMPESRGSRLGLRLGSAALDWAKHAGLDVVRLTTGVDERARVLVYEPLDFVVVGFDQEMDDYIMERVL